MWKFVLLLCCFVGSRLYAQKINASGKISPALMEKMASTQGDSLMVSMSFVPSANTLDIQKRIRIFHFISPDVFIGRIKSKDLLVLGNLHDVRYINELVLPVEELSSGASDPTLNRINYVYARFPRISGDSLQVSIKERLFDTSDIDLKGRIIYTGWEAPTTTAHASLMATIIAGGGNSSPFAKGAAPHALIASASFGNLFPEPDSVYQKNKIFIQNHSYGTVVENFYGNEAASYDAQSNRIPTLLHIFSAGNSGSVTSVSGPYAGVPAYANLTGNFKQAKNNITVGAVDSTGQAMPLGSKGPAFDGRVKPELMAYGEDGSSGAAALVSGVALLIQQAYREINKRLPSSSLVKSVLINSANDMAMPHLDFLSGYGSLNAFKAVNTIEQRRYAEQMLTQSEVQVFDLVVPSGISQLKITLTWNDPAAPAGSNKTLVNDLDMELQSQASGQSWLPWVLDHTPNTNSLQAIAQRKRDSLNTVEQITLDQPVAGNYQIKITGSAVTGPAQKFSISWQLDTLDHFYWTYPAATDQLLAANTHLLRWETNVSGPGNIEYATSGNNWKNAGTVGNVAQQYFRWTLPDTVATAVVRIKTLSGSIIESDTFTISPQLSLKVGFQCSDSFLLFWNALTPSYRLYELGSRYLQLLTTVPDTSVLIFSNKNTSLYYAVAPVINGKEGLRSATINYAAQGTGCYFKTFFLQSQTVSAANFTAELGSTFGLSELSFEKLMNNGWNNLKTISFPATLRFSLTDTSLVQGDNRYRLKLKLINGLVLYSNIESVFHLPLSPVVLYPNPVRQNEMLTILSNEAGRYQMQLINATGQLMYMQDVNSSIIKLNTLLLSKGIYMVRITDRKGKPMHQKLVVY